MKRFRFRLQTVLNYRRSLKKEEERNLARRNNELHDAESRLESIIEAQDAGASAAESCETMAELMLAGEYQQVLRTELDEQRKLVKEAAEAVDEAREAYVEKAVDAEMLETLRRRRTEEHAYEMRRKERKAVDEHVVQRHRFSGTERTSVTEGTNDE